MKKLSLVLLLWLCAICLVFGQVNSARRALFNEANGTVGKRVPSGWKEWEGLFWKSTDIAIGKDYTALQVKGNIVELAMVGCLFANSSAQTRWIKESYDTLVADRWEILSNNAGDWVLKKGDILVTYESSTTDDGTLTTAVVFMNQSTALAAGGNSGPTWTAVDLGRIFGTTGAQKDDGIYAIAYGDNKFVAGGSRGKMATSTDGVRWTAVSNSRLGNNFIYAIAYGNNRFVAGGDNGQMAYSSNGTAWTAVDLSSIFGQGNLVEPRGIQAIAYGNNRFVAVGYGAKIATSTDGVRWTAVDLSRIFANDDGGIRAIAYGNGRFVASGYDDKYLGKIATSTDGTTWTAVDASRIFGTSSIYPIVYGNNKFVAGSGNKMATSTNGTNWTAVDVSRIFGDCRIYAIAYGNGKFVAGGEEGKMATSTDGTTWTAVSDSKFGTDWRAKILAVAYGNNRFVAGGLYGRAAYSSE